MITTDVYTLFEDARAIDKLCESHNIKAGKSPNVCGPCCGFYNSYIKISQMPPEEFIEELKALKAKIYRYRDDYYIVSDDFEGSGHPDDPIST